MEDIGDVLTRIRKETEAAPGQGRDLELVGEFVGRDGDFYTLDVAAGLQHVVLSVVAWVGFTMLSIGAASVVGAITWYIVRLKREVGAERR